MALTVYKQIQYSKQNPRRQKTPPGVFQSKQGSVEYISMMMQGWPDYNWKQQSYNTPKESVCFQMLWSGISTTAVMHE